MTNLVDLAFEITQEVAKMGVKKLTGSNGKTPEFVELMQRFRTNSKENGIDYANWSDEALYEAVILPLGSRYTAKGS